MSTKIKDDVGVEMAGPDDPVLAVAKARGMGGTARVDARSQEQMSREYLEYQDACRERGRPASNFEDWAERTFCGSFQSASEHGTSRLPPREAALGVREQAIQRGLMSGSAGPVSAKQAGILPTGGISVTDEMVHRAMSELVRHANPLGASAVRATLEAALRG